MTTNKNVPHRFASTKPDCSGIILCRCGTKQKTSRNGTVARHRNCSFSGQTLTFVAISKRKENWQQAVCGEVNDV